LINKYFPKDTNLLSKIYTECLISTNPLIWQEHLWNYRNPETRENRAQEIIHLINKVLEE